MTVGERLGAGSLERGEEDCDGLPDIARRLCPESLALSDRCSLGLSFYAADR